jgi:hypothetical protein
MASIDLHLHEVEEGWMPAVCARCGDAAQCTGARTIVWSPWWMPLVVIVTGFLILVPFVRVLLFGALDSGRRVTMHLPFCERHRHHWRWRFWLLAAVLLAALGLVAGGITLASLSARLDPANEVDILGLSIAAVGVAAAGIGVLGVVGWRILAAILWSTAIRISNVSGTALTMRGVDKVFSDAVAERRGGRLPPASFARLDDDERPRRKRHKACPACGAMYSPRRPRCPECAKRMTPCAERLVAMRHALPPATYWWGRRRGGPVIREPGISRQVAKHP